jgi:hypothetical protein
MSDLGTFGYEIKDFCKAAHISKSTFYALQRKGLGPRITKVTERRTLVAPEDVQQWLEDQPRLSSKVREPQAA